MPGSFGLAFSTAVCAANIRVEILPWELGASLSSASASFPFKLEVVTEDKDSPIYHTNISTHMVYAHTEVLNASPKEPGTKTLPPLKTCREAETSIVSGCDDVGPI